MDIINQLQRCLWHNISLPPRGKHVYEYSLGSFQRYTKTTLDINSI